MSNTEKSEQPEVAYRQSCPACDTFMSWDPNMKVWRCPRCGHQE